MASNLQTLVYISATHEEFSRSEIASLLEVSRSNNNANDITGLLLHAGGGFIQVLEGRADAIDQTFQTICNDERHKNIAV